jgi:prepilin-type N-terminal cleavage/methylation domain-containing protein
MTLIELLVAMTILAIALIAYLDISGAASSANKKGDLYAIATRYANSQLETALADGVSLLTDGVVTSSISALPNGVMKVTTGAPAGVSSSTDIKEVDVTITWSETGTTASTGGTLTMSTMVALLK